MNSSGMRMFVMFDNVSVFSDISLRENVSHADRFYQDAGKIMHSSVPILRLLSGVKKLFIFQHNDGKVTVRNDVVVTHLTNVSKC